MLLSVTRISIWCARTVLVLVVLQVHGTGLGQPSAPTRGDIVMEKYLAHEAAQLSRRVLDGTKTLDEWKARRPRLKQELLEMLGLWPLPENTRNSERTHSCSLDRRQ